MKKIILASTSKYRQQLLSKSGIFFSCLKPLVDEDSLKLKLLTQQCSPLQLAEELSRQKGLSLLQNDVNQNALIISGDQLVEFENEILGKAHSYENAFLQLKKLNNKSHQLITAITVTTLEKVYHLNHITNLKMKNLTDLEISNYLKLDTPYDCAGSYKIESYGISLFSEINSTDFTAIQGLPMLWLTSLLKELGYVLFENKNE